MGEVLTLKGKNIILGSTMVREMRLTNDTVPEEPFYLMETFTKENINVARNMVKELINSKMEHDTLEYILKIKKMEKEHFTIQTDRFTKVSGLTTENTVRAHIQTEIHTKEIGLMTSEMALEPTPMLHLVLDTLANESTERLTVPVDSFILIAAIKVPGLMAVFKELENTFLNLAVNNTVNTSQLKCQEIQKTMKQAQQLFLNGKQLKLLQ